jgi:hypothetical protein
LPVQSPDFLPQTGKNVLLPGMHGPCPTHFPSRMFLFCSCDDREST